MAVEIERKFLLAQELPRELLNVVRRQEIIQGYLCSDPNKVVRVRVTSGHLGTQAYLTVKGKADGISREEVETELLDSKVAKQLISSFCEGVVHKIRYTFPAKIEGNLILDKNLKPLSWEVDEFLGENEGLWIAEIELPSEDTPLIIPKWCGEEISTDHRFANVNLAKNPYRRWGK